MATPTISRDPIPALATDRANPAVLARLAERVVSVGERERLPVRAPFTGELLGHVPRCTDADVRAAAGRARTVQPGWARRSFRERAEVLLRFHDLLLQRQAEVLDLIQLEAGKARKHAFEEVLDAAIVARYYAHTAEEHLRARERQSAVPGLVSTRELHHPRGVAGFICPWNYPLSMGITDALPALMAGNAAVIKPDRQTPFTLLWAAELLREAGLPEGLCQTVTGEGPELGPPLIGAVDFVCFTGSTRTGRIVAREAAERLIPCSLELGGKNPMLVFGDAELDAAVDGAVRGVFASAGQLCISLERLYVQQSVYETFVERLVGAVLGLRLGAELDWDADVGSLVSAAQLRTVTEHVEDARAGGAAVLVGGKPRPDVGPLFYEPTVLEGVTPEMRVFAEEIFGPVVSVYPFRDAEDAIREANRSRYGLNASVWTRDADFGRSVAARLQTGSVNVNDAYIAAWASVDAPMGGFKESGIGRRHGREGIVKYTQSQTVAVQRGPALAAPPGVGEAAFARGMSAALRLLRRIPGVR